MEFTEIKLTQDIWNSLGFIKEKCVGGYYRYYHQTYLGRDFHYYNNGATISDGRLSFTVLDDETVKSGPKALHELCKVVFEVISKHSKESGIKEAQYNFRKACGLED